MVKLLTTTLIEWTKADVPREYSWSFAGALG